jgi:hypothetical protein
MPFLPSNAATIYSLRDLLAIEKIERSETKLVYLNVHSARERDSKGIQHRSKHPSSGDIYTCKSDGTDLYSDVDLCWW